MTMKKIFSLLMAAMILTSGGSVLAQSTQRRNTRKPKDQVTVIEGRQKVRQSDYLGYDKFTQFNAKESGSYYSPYNYTGFFGLTRGGDPDWAELKPVMNYLESVPRATATITAVFAVNPDITDKAKRQELIKQGQDEAVGALESFKGWAAKKQMRNKMQYSVAEIDYRYFKGANYYNEQRGDDLIHVGLFLYFGTKKKPVFTTDTTSHTFADIRFFPNDATILESWQTVLDDVAQYLKDNDRKGVLIVGHSDNQGTAAYVEGISRQRAVEVKKALLMRGVDANRIEVEARGDEEPVGDNDTLEGRALNNRVSIKVQ